MPFTPLRLAALQPSVLPEQPLTPPCPAARPPGHCSVAPSIPPRSPPSIAPLPPSLFMAVSKLQPPLEQLRPFDGDKAVKAAWEAPAWPGPGPAGPCLPPSPGGSPGPGWRALWISQQAHTSHARANFRDRYGVGADAPHDLPLRRHPPLALAPGPRWPANPEENNSPAEARVEGKGENRGAKGKGQFLFPQSQPPRSSSCPSRQVKSQGWGGDIS